MSDDFDYVSPGPRNVQPVSSIDHQQRRGAAWDIIDEALNSFKGFMLDDDYDYRRILYSIMARMQERRDMYRDGQKPD